MNTPNPEDQNPMLPNLRDECLSGMNSVVKGIFIGFAICVAAVIAWFFFLVTRPAKVQPKFENMPMLWTNGVEAYVMTNDGPGLIYESTPNTLRIFAPAPENEPWLSADIPANNNWHWTNVVFSSTREPVVTKTNGEWRIQFR